MSGGFCEFCGKPVAPAARFCGHCGKPHGPRQAAPASSHVPSGGAASSPAETMVFELRPLVVRTLLECLLCILTVGIGWICLWIARMGHRYRITTERIETREGVFAKRSRFVDLFRIEDFELQEPFFLRMRGAGHLIVRTMEKQDAVAKLEAIPDVRRVYEKLRTLARDDRTRKGVRVVEMG